MASFFMGGLSRQGYERFSMLGELAEVAEDGFRCVQQEHPRLAKSLSFVFNFSYGANSQLILSEHLRPGIEESKN